MMDKNLNTFCMRLKEGYGWHFPELQKLVTNNETYAKLVSFIGNKDSLTSCDHEKLKEILEDDEELANAIIER